MPLITPENTIFVMLSFEGPDIYSQAGGLGVRATELCRALAEKGYETHLFFIGDPYKPPVEYHVDGKLQFHRWCQWISKHHPNGVYDGEGGKIYDYEKSIPPYLTDNIIRPAAMQGKKVVVLAEEWHTTSTVVNLYWRMKYMGLGEYGVILWNANNTYGFWNIDWHALQTASTITTVSRYMKHLMWKWEINPMVIPNGIPKRILAPLNEEKIKYLQSIYQGEFFLVKVGRYTPDKRWIMAVDSVAHLKSLGYKVNLIMRGGMEPHRADVMFRAKQLGLSVREIRLSDPTFENITRALKENKDADLVELNFFIPEEFLRLLYASADAVLANSGHEPFGLVGLEVMATGGIPFVGASGEDYAQAFQNSISVETDDPREISSYLLYLMENPQIVHKIRHQAKNTANMFTWDRVLEDLLGKVEFIARLRK